MMFKKTFVLFFFLFLALADNAAEKSDSMVSSKSGFLESKTEERKNSYSETRKSWADKIKESFFDSIIGINKKLIRKIFH